MSILPLLPEPGVDGGRPAAGLLGAATATIRLGARVVALVGADALLDTAHGRALLRGAPALPPGTDLVLELPRTDPALVRTGRLVALGEQRLEPPLPVRLQPVPPAQAAAEVRSATPLEVSVRALGPDGQPIPPAFAVRLSVPLPDPAPAVPGGGALTAMVSGGAAARAGVFPGAPAEAPGSPTAAAPVTSQPAAAPAGPPTVLTAATTGTPSPMTRTSMPEHLGVLAARGQTIEAIVLSRDAPGPTLLRAAGVTLQVDAPLALPAGARLQLSLPAGPAGPGAAPLQAGPLEAARTLAACLREQADPTAPAYAALRLPEPSATLAARLLRLVQLIAPRPAAAEARRPAAPVTMEGQSGGARITAALAELGRLAGEPQSGGWRVLLLPLGFAGAPLLRLYVREDASERDGGRKDRDPQPSGAARRAVFELECGALGRCQIDVLCQARRFDLLVRTAQPLPLQLRRDIGELYRAARDVAGLGGAVRFRAGQLLALPGPGDRPGGITV
jgi:hypothetical protein